MREWDTATAEVGGGAPDRSRPDAGATGSDWPADRVAALAAYGRDLVLVVESGIIRYAGPSIRAVLGYRPGDIVGLRLTELVEDRSAGGLDAALDPSGFMSPARLEVLIPHADGSAQRFELHVVDAIGDSLIGGHVVHGRKVADRSPAANALDREALHDPLTGLPTRALLLERIDASANDAMAVVVLGLDRFNIVNDTLGHEAGDVALRHLAGRLQATAGPAAIVARLGGDTFAVAMVVTGDEAGITDLAESLVQVVAEPVDLGVQWVSLGARAGIAVTGGDEDASSLVRNADAAMYQAKRSGGSRVEWYRPEQRDRSARSLQLEQALRHAVVKDELVVHYQPIVDLADGRAVGVEALVRWHHPEFGLIPPVEFIPLAEQTGHIVEIGAHVLREACRTVAGWRRLGRDLHVSVNLSPRQLLEANFPNVVATVLADTGLPPAALSMEITESVLVDDGQFATAALDRLRSLGLRLSIDDFGTGYSSLLYLRRLQADTLKIDRSFVDGLGRDAEDEAIVATVINLANSLGLAVIAEGVETEGQRERLIALGCNRAQGYLFSRPVDRTTFDEWAEDHVNALPSTSTYVPFRSGRHDEDVDVDVDGLTRLRAEAAFYQALVEEAPHATLTFDGTGVITFATRNVEPMFGARVADNLGSNITEWVEPEELEYAMESLAFKLEHGNPSLQPVQLHHTLDGRRRRVQVVGSDDNQFASDRGISVVLRDITPRHITEQIIDSVMRTEPIDQTLSIIADLAHEQLRTSGVTIAFEPDGSTFRQVIGSRVGEGLRLFAHRCGIGAEAGLPWEITVRESRLCVQVDHALPDRLRAAAAAHGFLACWSMPLVAPGGAMLGAITLWLHDTLEPGPSEQRFLTRLAETASFAIDRWLEAEARDHATRHDELTGLMNRWRFEECLDAARRRRRDDIGVGVVFIDLDDFGDVNDRFGEDVGDAVLQGVAQRLAAVIGPDDVLARFGGDEFAVLRAVVTDPDDLDGLARRILTVLDEPIIVPGGTVCVGGSVGVALDQGDGSATEDVLAGADRDLHRAKLDGRRRGERVP